MIVHILNYYNSFKKGSHYFEEHDDDMNRISSTSYVKAQKIIAKYPKVRSIEVEKIGTQLRYSLILNKIPQQNIDNYLLSEATKLKGEVSIEEIQGILER